jgi:hypothetical protein
VVALAEKSPPLRAVEPGETAPPKKPLTLVEAVEAGDYLGILRAQRRDIAASLPDEKGPAKAALHRQLSIVAKEIALLEQRDPTPPGPEPVGDEPFDYGAL